MSVIGIAFKGARWHTFGSMAVQQLDSFYVDHDHGPMDDEQFMVITESTFQPVAKAVIRHSRWHWLLPFRKKFV